jgi:membrane-bound ClpP family serine protease
MEYYWVWAVLLLLVGFALAVMDILVPSGGIFAFLALVAVIVSVVLGFFTSSTFGVVVLAVALVGIPVVVIVALKVLPDTPIGRRVLLQAPTQEEVLPDPEQRRTLESLVGRSGRAKSKMLPSGIVTIDNRSYDAVGEGQPIDVGQAVRVIEVRGQRLIVERLGDEPAQPASADPLAQPFDWDEPKS